MMGNAQAELVHDGLMQGLTFILGSRIGLAASVDGAPPIV